MNNYAKNEMTYAEYKELYNEYINSDSVKRREEIIKKVTEVASNLIKRTDLLYRRYGSRLLKYYVSFEIDIKKKCPLDEKFVYLCYDDYATQDENPDYGESIKVDMELLDPECFDKLASELREHQISCCEAANENYEHDIRERTEWIRKNNELKEKLISELGRTISEIIEDELKEEKNTR